MTVLDQVGTTEEVSVEDVVTEAVDFVNVEEAGEEKEETGTATVENEVEDGLSEEIEDVTPPADDKKGSAKTEVEKSEQKDDEEEASLEDIMADSKVKPDAEKSEADKAAEFANKGVQKRINELTRKNKEALEAKDEEIAELKGRLLPDKRPPVPVEGDFVTKEEFQEAYQNWKDQDDEWKSNKKRVEKQTKAAKERFNANVEKYKASMKRMQDKYDDFNKLVNDEETAVNFQHLAPVIRATDFGPEIGYHLAKNPKKLTSMLELDDVSAILAIGEMVGRCRTPGSKSITTAPGTFKTVQNAKGGDGGDGSGITTAEIDKMSKGLLGTA